MINKTKPRKFKTIEDYQADKRRRTKEWLETNRDAWNARRREAYARKKAKNAAIVDPKVSQMTSGVEITK